MCIRFGSPYNRGLLDATMQNTGESRRRSDGKNELQSGAGRCGKAGPSVPKQPRLSQGGPVCLEAGPSVPRRARLSQGVMQKGSTRELLKGAHAWVPLLEPLKKRTD